MNPRSRPRRPTSVASARGAAAIAAALVAAGCGASDDDAQAPSSTAAPTPSTRSATDDSRGFALGPGLTIAEARATDAEGPLLVRGALVVEDGTARLCSELAESAPPQCAGDALEVEGLNVSSVDGLEREGAIQWAPEAKLLGEVEGSRLVIAGGTSG